MASILKLYKSEYQKALEYLELEVQVRLLHDLPNIHSTYLKSAILNSYLDKNELAVKYANLALKHTNNGKITGTVLNILGDVLFKTKPVEADKYYVESERLFLAEKDEYNLSHVRLSIARLEGFKLNLSTGLNICQEELNKGIELKNPGIIGTAYLRFAEIYSFNNELKKSKSYAEKALAIGIENNWKVLIWEVEGLINK
jgi:tetratricopeptide (TPR) repeat protein